MVIPSTTRLISAEFEVLGFPVHYDHAPSFDISISKIVSSYVMTVSNEASGDFFASIALVPSGMVSGAKRSSAESPSYEFPYMCPKAMNMPLINIPVVCDRSPISVPISLFQMCQFAAESFLFVPYIPFIVIASSWMPVFATSAFP